ncbi:MAG: hypothetical protein WCE64_16410, partial [Bacteroidales bacterium]
VVLGIHCYIPVEKHPNKIKRSYEAMPQASEEAVLMSCQALIDHFVRGTPCRDKQGGNRQKNC